MSLRRADAPGKSDSRPAVSDLCASASPRDYSVLHDPARLLLIAGPCSLENESVCRAVAGVLAELRDARPELNIVFKGSFDKANRTSLAGARGTGIDAGLTLLAMVKRDYGFPVLTDVHESAQVAAVAEVCEVVQIPAFLCRQTDLLLAAAATGRVVNVKKGQFLSPVEMGGAARKLSEAGCTNVMLTERGTFFGYHRLVNDFLGLGDLMELKSDGGSPPVCFDCTHSTQLPGSGEQTGGRPDRAPLLARAATAAGVQALFIECHPEPAKSLSDSSTVLPLDTMPGLLKTIAAIRNATDAV